MNKSLARAVAAAAASASLLAPAALFAQTAGTGSTTGSTSATGTPPPAGMAGGSAATGSRAAGASLHATDRRFVEQAALSDLAEIATSKLAQQRGTSDKVKQFAQHMIDDHTKTSEKLKPMAQAKGVDLPSAPDRAHQRMMAKLEKESGDKFDREYMRGQVKDHEKAVSLFERQAKSGRDADLKQFAADTLPSLREHLQMAKDGQRGGMAGGDRNMDRNSTGSATSMSVKGSGGASGASAGMPAAGTGTSGAMGTSGAAGTGGSGAASTSGGASGTTTR